MVRSRAREPRRAAPPASHPRTPPTPFPRAASRTAPEPLTCGRGSPRPVPRCITFVPGRVSGNGSEAESGSSPGPPSAPFCTSTTRPETKVNTYPIGPSNPTGSPNAVESVRHLVRFTWANSRHLGHLIFDCRSPLLRDKCPSSRLFGNLASDGARVS